MVSITVDDNILLRSYQTDDADALFTAVDNSRKHLHTWLDWVDNTIRPEHSLQYIQASIHEANVQQSLILGIFYNNQIVGGIGMHNWDQATKRAQLGYWISKEHEGKGIVHKSMVKFVDFLFEKIGLNKTEIHFFPANTRSAKVAERLGFKIEGIIRQSHIRHGMAEDIVIAGLLRSEFTPNPSR